MEMECFAKLSKKKNYIYIGLGIIVLIIIIVILAKVIGGSKNKAEDGGNQKDGSIISATPYDLYLNTKKFLYVWNYPNADNFVKFVVDHKFSRVYLYCGCIGSDVDNLSKGILYSSGNIDAKQLIQILISKGIEVEIAIYINDQPDDFTNVDKVENVAKALAELRKTLKFKALHFDVEPQNSNNYEALLKMYETARKYIPVSAILKPGWLKQKMSDLTSAFSSYDYYSKFKDCETFIDALMTVTDYSDLMAYNYDYKEVNTFLDNYDIIRKRHSNHTAAPVLELDPNQKTDGMAETFSKDKDYFFNYIANISQRFDGITIHQYEVWYQNLYCEKPTQDSEYYNGKPKDCIVS